MKHVVVGLGANLGAGQETLEAAALALHQAYPNNFTASPSISPRPSIAPGKSAFLECPVVRFSVPETLTPERLRALLALEQVHGQALGSQCATHPGLDSSALW